MRQGLLILAAGAVAIGVAVVVMGSRLQHDGVTSSSLSDRPAHSAKGIGTSALGHGAVDPPSHPIGNHLNNLTLGQQMRIDPTANGPILLHARPDSSQAQENDAIVSPGTQAVVLEVVETPVLGERFYQVRLADGRTGWITGVSLAPMTR
jgi:hypothetical protein